jgi:GT2 family glycosyltransferase
MKITVVIATYNRGALLLDLLRDLAAQVDPGPFDVVLVDDGSQEPARNVLEGQKWPFALQLIEQANTGQARARHNGIAAASGEIIAIVDDDMALPPDFLAAHRELHERGSEVVLGLIRPAGDLDRKPLFERFHAGQLELLVQDMRRSDQPISGMGLCTGNVSFRRWRYLQVGGFDPALARSEDRDLGIRLERIGARLSFSERAYTLHRSDHTDLEVWKRRAYLYGVYDFRIARKYPSELRHDPWLYMMLVNPLSRPFLLGAVAAPALGTLLSTRAMRASEWLDRHGFERVAIKGTTLVYGLEYFRGVRSEYSTVRAALAGFGSYLRRSILQRFTP